MNKELNPVLVAIIIAIIVIGAGAWMWNRAQGTTFTKSSVRGIQFDPSKAKGQ